MQAASEASVDGSRIPRLAPDWDPSGSRLSPAEGFLLSRIDGHTPWSQLRLIGGIPPEQVDRCLERWIAEGVVEVSDTGDLRVGGSAGKGEPEPEEGDPVEALLEPEIDLPLDFQRRVLAFEATLDRPYHELLEVERDADGRAIKRAYFARSKEFHPDRYYRKDLGGFRARLEQIFKKIVEAYELLSDPTTRAEIEKSLAQAPPRPTGGKEDRALARKRQVLERLRKQFHIPEAILTERRFKARQFYQAAMISGRKGEWLEAASSVRLAIAFDPWSDEYKAGFAEVQAQVHQIRAAELLERAQHSLDSSAIQEAMRLYEEALSFRPGDPEINHQAARVALELGDVARAVEYAETACGMRPDHAPYFVTLGKVRRREGVHSRAREAFAEAHRLDPQDEEARGLLELSRRKSNRRGGGKS